MLVDAVIVVEQIVVVLTVELRLDAYWLQTAKVGIRQHTLNGGLLL